MTTIKIAFFLNRLNHHQVQVADELYALLGDKYKFVELCEPNEGSQKGDKTDYSSKPYLVQAWKSESDKIIAQNIAITFDACVFGTLASYPFQKLRLKENKLSFEVSERWLKRGMKNVVSPTISRMFLTYWMEGWYKKPLYKLCSSAFAASDHKLLGMYKGKCYKWGYFTKVEKSVEASTDVSTSEITPLMWCSRFLMLKHPELPILMAKRLKDKGYKFILDMYGSGEYEEASKSFVRSLGLSDIVKFHGNVPNNQVHDGMRNAEIFLFTSDRYEGWGAVANESMSEGCVLVASNHIGSAPYLIKDNENGFLFTSSKVNCSFDNPDIDALESLTSKVEWLLDHPHERKMMQKNATNSIQKIWSPQNAASSLLTLIDNLTNNKEMSIMEGPCSKA